MIKIIIKSESRYPVDRKKLRDFLKKVFKVNNIVDNVQLDISFVGDRKMIALNKKHMKREGTTNVLSFPLLDDYKQSNEKRDFVLPPDNVLRLGDIVISYPQARKEAMVYNLTMDEQINKLAEHGLLHLLGEHHK